MKVASENPTFKFLINGTLEYYSIILLATGEFRWIRCDFFSTRSSKTHGAEINTDRQISPNNIGGTAKVRWEYRGGQPISFRNWEELKGGDTWSGPGKLDRRRGWGLFRQKNRL